MRHFRTPSGGRWTAELCRITQCSFGSGSSIAVSGSVLRFTSVDGIIFDLEDWPSNWGDLTERSLIELLRQASTGQSWPFGWMARG